MDKTERKERAVTMFRYYVAGQTLQEIGDQYGLTRERIRQVLDQSFGDRVHVVRKINKDSDKRVMARLTAKKCDVCYASHHRNGVTCSKRCSKLHVLTRYRRDPEYRDNHRYYRAKSVVNHSEKYNDVDIRHAKAILDGTAKRYSSRLHRNSQAARAMLVVEGLRGIID